MPEGSHPPARRGDSGFTHPVGQRTPGEEKIKEGKTDDGLLAGVSTSFLEEPPSFLYPTPLPPLSGESQFQGALGDGGTRSLEMTAGHSPTLKELTVWWRKKKHKQL